MFRGQAKCPPGLSDQKRGEMVEEALRNSLEQIVFCGELQEKANPDDWKDRVVKDLGAGTAADAAPLIPLPEGRNMVNWRHEFTDDVIYSLDALDVAFDFRGLCSETPTQKEERIKDELSRLVPLRLGSISGLSLDTEYLIFNARKRRFEYVKGVPNSVFAAALFKSTEAMQGLQAFRGIQTHVSAPSLMEMQRAAFCRALLNDAFEFCGRNGSKSTPIDLLATRGSFTPQFYPRRFVLKDCMYESKLGSSPS